MVPLIDIEKLQTVGPLRKESEEKAFSSAARIAFPCGVHFRSQQCGGGNPSARNLNGVYPFENSEGICQSNLKWTHLIQQS